MNALRRILVVADAGTRQPALARALSIAPAAGGRLELVGFVYDPAAEPGSGLGSRDRARLKRALLEERRIALEAEVARWRLPQTVPVRVVWTRHLSLWLCTEAPRRADLVVKTHHPSGQRFHTPSDWHLLRELSVPLWLVAPSQKRRVRGPVLATLDAGDHHRAQVALDRRVFGAAVDWAERLGRDLHVAYVRRLPQLLLDFDLADKRHLKQVEAGRAETLLAERLKEIAPRGATVTAHGRVGLPGHELATLCRRLDPALVVVGTHARRGPLRWFLGSTVEASVTTLGRDVLVVRTPRA